MRISKLADLDPIRTTEPWTLTPMCYSLRRWVSFLSKQPLHDRLMRSRNRVTRIRVFFQDHGATKGLDLLILHPRIADRGGPVLCPVVECNRQIQEIPNRIIVPGSQPANQRRKLIRMQDASPHWRPQVNRPDRRGQDQSGNCVSFLRLPASHHGSKSPDNPTRCHGSAALRRMENACRDSPANCPSMPPTTGSVPVLAPWAAP